MSAEKTLFRDLMSLVTDDFAALWELQSLAERYPKSRLASRMRITELLRELVRDDFVKLYLGTEFAGEEVEVPAERVAEALANSENWNWDRPRGSEFLQVAATGKGRVAYLTDTHDMKS